MSVSTLLTIESLARDPSGLLVGSSGALRRAENVVIRAAGVAESRPNFEVLVEDTETNFAPKNLVEFDGTVFVVAKNGDTWQVKNTTGTDGPFAEPLPGAFTPVDFGLTETKFAEARKNLYMTGSRGIVAFEAGSPGTADARVAGVEMNPITDWHGAELSYADLFVGWDPAHPEDVVPITEQEWAVAYKFVFVKKDSNGYIRRSPPSYDLITTCLPSINAWGSGTRFYIPYYTSGAGAVPVLVAGDSVEFYRTLAVPMGTAKANIEAQAPIPVYYLAFTYTITADDVDNGYFVPPKDVVPENDLGAELYTDVDQGGAGSAKYAPPQAQAIANWQRCMWYGNTVSKHRSPEIVLQHLYRAGVMRNLRIASCTLGLDTVTLEASTASVSAAGLVVGMLFTDNFKYGPTVDGPFIPANTRILKIDTITFLGLPYTQLTLSNNAFDSGTTLMGTMDADSPQGLLAEKTGTGVYVNGSKIVTSLTSTAGWKPGMYWTDCTSGPGLDGAKVRNQTFIESVDSPTQITMTTAALHSGTVDAFVGDTITVDGLTLYAWIEFFGASQDLTAHTRIAPWSGDYPYCFPIHDARYGDWGRQSAIASICYWLNYYAALQGTKALPNGWLPTVDYILEGWAFSTTPVKLGDTLSGQSANAPDIFNGEGTTPYPNGCTGFTLEEVGVGGGAHTISSTCPSAFSPPLDAPTTSPTTNDARANRLYFSQTDEPEAVSLTSYFEIGDQRYPILSLVPLRNALLVFKADGLWRVTGVAPDQWSVDLLDPTLHLVRSEAVATAKNVAFAWGDRGFFAITEDSVQSLSAGKLDNELRTYLSYVQQDSHGAIVVPWQSRQLVLFCVPASAETATVGKIYCYSLNTSAFSEWTQDGATAWNTAAGSKTDNLYTARSGRYEVREALPNIQGYDRSYFLARSDVTVLTFAGVTTAIVNTSAFGPWDVQVGDALSRSISEVHEFRRITEVVDNDGTKTLTLESAFSPVGSLPETTHYGGHEMASCILAIEWQPTAPAGVPTGVVAREIQVQMDLRAPYPESTSSIPRYEVGATSERDTSPWTLVSNKARVQQIQPLRVGVSFQVARNANLAPILITSDVYPLRVNGISIVFEGTSEKTTR